MLLIDIDDTLNFITLGVSFDLIIHSENLEIDDKKEISRQQLIGFIDEDISKSKELENYIVNNYKNFVPRLAWSKDATANITNYLDANNYSILYRGSVSKERYSETGGSVCEEIHDKLLEFGISPKSEYNVSFFFNKKVASKLIKNYGEVYTASTQLASLADEIDSIERVFLQVTSSNNAQELFEKSNTGKIILVSNLFHMCQIRQLLSL